MIDNIVLLKRRPIGNIELLKDIDIPIFLKKIYAKRGITKIDELNLSTSNLVSYHCIFNIEKAVNILVKSIKKNYVIVVIGDFDVDGAVSTALAILSLRKMGAQIVKFLIPNRFKDGYGVSSEIIEKAINLGAQIIITVDNGISSHHGINLARNHGIIVIITDHHLPIGNTLPNANVIINPNVGECNILLKTLSGVGVVFYLMIALRRELIHLGWFIQKKIKIPKLAELLDLVALGTIADVVPLNVNNRILIYQGLNRIRANKCCIGIKVLLEISNRNIKKVCTEDISFVIGPLINSAGRINDMSIAVSLLLTNNVLKARTIALKLTNLNNIRRKIEHKMQFQAINLCKEIISYNKSIPFGLVLYDKYWHQGVIGILASRIKDYFYRPAIVFCYVTNEIIKGSGRSIEGINIYNLIKDLNKLYPEIILNYGGHSMAIGLTLKKNNLNKFSIYFAKLVCKYLNNKVPRNIIWSDGELNNLELSLGNAELIRNSSPWGETFPYPVFDGVFYVLKQKIVKKKHLKLILSTTDKNSKILDSIFFNVDLNLWPNKKVFIVRIAYRMIVNEFYNNKKLQLLIQYIWPY